MERHELLEWLGLILAIVVWWPALFGWFPLPYEIFVWVFSGGIVTVVLIRRIRRVREGLRYSREIMDAQRRSQPLPPLERDEDKQEEE